MRFSAMGWSVLLVAIFLFTHDEEAGAATKLEKIPANHPVKLQLMDGTLIKGKFIAVSDSPESLYSARYATWRGTRNDIAMPARGSTVELRSKSRVIATGEFRGFDKGVALLRKPGQAGLTRVDFGKFVAMVDSAGNELTTMQLRQLDAAGQIPVSTGIRLQTADGVRFVAIDEIKSGNVVTSGAEKAAGTATVMAVVLVGLVALAVAGLMGL